MSYSAYMQQEAIIITSVLQYELKSFSLAFFSIGGKLHAELLRCIKVIIVTSDSRHFDFTRHTLTKTPPKNYVYFYHMGHT